MAGETESHDRNGEREDAQPRRARKRAETLARIQHVALRLFEEQGFDAVTVPQIAAAAGVSRATVFRYFPSKDDIVFATSDEEVDALRVALRAHPRALADRSEMVAALASFIEFLERDTEGLARRFAVVTTEPQLRARALAVRAAFGDAVAEELAGGGRPDVRIRVIASAVTAALVLTVRHWRERGGRDDLKSLLLDALSTLSFEAAPGGDDAADGGDRLPVGDDAGPRRGLARHV